MKRGTWAAIAATSAALAVDAVGVALKSEPGAGSLRSARLFGEAFAFELWLALALGLLLGAALDRVGGAPHPAADSSSDHSSGYAEDHTAAHTAAHSAPGHTARHALRLSPGVLRRDVLSAALPLLSAWSLALYAAVLTASVRLHNRELSALMIVVAALLSLAIIVPCGNFISVACANWRARSPRLALAWLFVAWLTPLLTLAGLSYHNKSGFAQLNPWLGASLLGALLAFTGVYVGLRKRGGHLPARLPRLGLIAGALSLVLAVVSAVVPWQTAARVAQSGSVTRYALLGLRSATDFDRDGYSGWWGGGDCQSFNAAVHPGAVEIVGDGIDNNCLGGDATQASDNAAPEFAALPRGVPPRPNLLLITVETLRADAVGFSELTTGVASRHKTTPNLDAYAKRSVVFENYFATTPWTRLSLPAILSSRTPTRMHWKAQGRSQHMRSLQADTPWIPSLLKQSGYATVAILNSFRAFTRAESAGFERGFDVFDTSTQLSYSGGTMRGHIGQAQARLATAQLTRLKDKPFFLWLHLMEPHYLYQRSRRAPDFGSTEQDLYASEVWEVDAVVGEVLQTLQDLQLDDNTIVSVVGDHGEEFKEHGERWHGSNLLQPQIHTAGLMHVPGLPAMRIREAVSHEDLGPTWLNLAGVQRGYSSLQGRSLVPLFTNQPLQRGYFFLERFEVNDGSGFMAAVVHYPFKLVYTEEGRRLELYDLQRDPSEQQTFPREGDAYQTLEDLLLRHVDAAKR